MAQPLAGRRVMVTGGGGFLGQAVVARLEQRARPRSSSRAARDYDLRTRDGIERALADGRPDVVIHLAAVVGGIGANRENPGRFFYENAIMGIELIEEARLAGVDKFVTIGTVCAYPKFTPVPFHEDDLWDGYPEETNAPYGLAKKMLLVQGQAYRAAVRVQRHPPDPGQPLRPGRQLRPGELARHPGADQEVRRRPRGRRATTSRSGARARRRASSCTSTTPPRGSSWPPSATTAPSPVNLGVGREITIRDLVELIARLTGFEGEIRWDATKPDGQPRRALDTSRARERFGFEARRPSRTACGRRSSGTSDTRDAAHPTGVAAGTGDAGSGRRLPRPRVRAASRSLVFAMRIAASPTPKIVQEAISPCGPWRYGSNEAFTRTRASR